MFSSKVMLGFYTIPQVSEQSMYIYSDLITVMRYVSAAMRKTERKNIVSIIYSITQLSAVLQSLLLTKTTLPQ